MRRAAAALGLGLVLTLGVPSSAGASTTRPWLGWSTSEIAGIDATSTALGLRPGAISAYSPFDEPFPHEWADSARGRGVPLVLAWEPWDWDRPTDADQPEYSLQSIANGTHDHYVHDWARAAAASNVTILLRFAPEMNGDWRPWSIGDTPEDFVQAWRHLHDLFQQDGVTNVRWAFNPNVEYPGSIPLKQFWPGARYVDWTAVDGYNWWGVKAGWPYQSVSAVFGATVAELRALAPGMPMMIAECAAGPGAKRRWIQDLVRTAPTMGVRLVVWFEHDKETDWRMTTAHLPEPMPDLLRASDWRIPD